MTIWLIVFLATLGQIVDGQPKITESKILLVRDDSQLSTTSFLAVLQLPEDLIDDLPAEQFIARNLKFEDLAPNVRAVTFMNHFVNPRTKRLEPNQFIGSLQKKPTKHAEILSTKGKFVITKTSELVGYRIGLQTELSQGLTFQIPVPSENKPEPLKTIQSGWAIEIEIEGQGTYTEMVPTTHSLVWLTAGPSGFTIALPDEKDPLKTGKKVFAGNDLVIYRYTIFPSKSAEPKEPSQNKAKKT